MSSDQVILVDINDREIGHEDKFAAHRHPAKLHRAVSVWIMRRKLKARSQKSEVIQVLLQKRSQEKIVGAAWWGNGICGNVRPGESYLDCAQRRLREELGLKPEERNKNPERLLKPLYKFHYQVFANEEYGEHEIDQVFLLDLSEQKIDLQLNPREVSEVAWVDWSKLLAATKSINYPTIKETLKTTTDQLANLTPPVDVDIDGRQFLLTPWTTLMLKDPRLQVA